MEFATHVNRIREKLRALTRVQIIKIGVGVAILVLGLLWHFFVSAPASFPINSFVSVEEGVPLSTIADSLKERGVIRSPLLFIAWSRLTGIDREVHAGKYVFKQPLTLFEVAGRIERGETGVESARVTFTEGMTAKEMAMTLEESLPDFDNAAFLETADPHEGYLFPDTYFIEPGTGPAAIVARLKENFSERTEGLAITEDVVIMASLIEKEARTPEDRRLVSGILWNRIEQDMRLQVDAVFGYIKGISGYVPNGDDPELDSPYNTYLYKGLPPGPISNPGLDSIAAALNPADTDYLYYLTGHDGQMYYARTFEEHKRNREQYLD